MCPSLNWLDLRNNNITSLPPEISKLRYMTTARIPYIITMINNIVIRNLKTLLLEGNNLTGLPPELGEIIITVVDHTS